MLQMKDKLLKVPQVAERLGVTRQTVYEYIKEGDIKSMELPTGITRIKESDLSNFIKRLNTSKLSPYF